MAGSVQPSATCALKPRGPSLIPTPAFLPLSLSSYIASVTYQGVAFLRHLRRAATAHGLHSPYIYQLYVAIQRAARLSAKPWLNNALQQQTLPIFWAQIEAERAALRASKQTITITDFGSGSRVSQARERQLGAVARSGLLPVKWCRRLAALRDRLPPGPVLELGTSLGITTAYLASVAEKHPVITLEGCPSSLAVAQGLWARLDIDDRIRPILGNIDDTLTEALAHGPFSLIVLDANHRSGPVQAYFEAVLPHLSPGGCIVVDDIYWTRDMTRAWLALCQHPAVGQQIDFYRQGWLFLSAAHAKERFVLQALG
jgi:predicted O-methyltransferase YrrM